jgi:hypothetical protein
LANDETLRAIRDLDSSVRTLADGLSRLTLTLGHHGAMLGQILEAVADQDEANPLVDALRALVAVCERNAAGIEQNTAGIERIERLLRPRPIT